MHKKEVLKAYEKTSKSISYTNIGFPFETYMKLCTRFFEAKASEFFNKAKKKDY